MSAKFNGLHSVNHCEVHTMCSASNSQAANRPMTVNPIHWIAIADPTANVDLLETYLIAREIIASDSSFSGTLRTASA